MLAFVFPGQGGERQGMGRPWVGTPAWHLVDLASEVTGHDVRRLLLDATTNELRLTTNAHLATLVVSLMGLEMVVSRGIRPMMCAGHSLGEYAALVAAGVLSNDDALLAVAERSEAMQYAAEQNPGSMASVVGLTDEELEAACLPIENAWIASYDAPRNAVVSGDFAAVDQVGKMARKLGASQILPLEVAGPFHTPLMHPALDRLCKVLEALEYHAASCPVVANVDARARTGSDAWEYLLTAQVRSPVRWRQIVLRLVELGCSTFVELGASSVPNGLVKGIATNACALAVLSPDDIDVAFALRGVEIPVLDEMSCFGERLDVPERLVVSPFRGLFQPLPVVTAPAEGDVIPEGAVVGTVGGIDVHSPFAGLLMGVLAAPGERIIEGQPIAWLRTA